MKGLVDHLIASEEELERELEQEYEGRKFPSMEHVTLLAIQLSGKLTDEDIIDLYEIDMLKEWLRKFLKKDLIMHARYCLRQQQKVGFKTVSFLDVLTYPKSIKRKGINVLCCCIIWATWNCVTIMINYVSARLWSVWRKMSLMENGATRY